MSKTVEIVIAACGVVICACAGYFSYRYYKKKKSSKTCNEPNEVEHIDYASFVNEHKNIVRDNDDNKHSKYDIPKEKFAEGVVSYMESGTPGKNFEEYMAEMERPEDDEGDDDEEEDDEDKNDISCKSSGPYPITAAEFCNTRMYYDKISVNYYTDDDIVCDDRDVILDHFYRVIGDLKAIVAMDPNREIFYIRNESLEVDYEIVIVRSSYRKEVLGDREMTGDDQ